MSVDSVDSRHPAYTTVFPDWKVMDDTALGERRIKELGEEYLPSTSGMRVKGAPAPNTEGWKMYQAYKQRASFPEIVQPAINTLVGLMHREPADIKLPAAMEPLRDNATQHGESLQVLLRQINEQQLKKGRVGLLVDIPTGGSDVLPYIVTYTAETIINWDTLRMTDGREHPVLIVLDESSFERTSRFSWEFVNKFLVLDLGDPNPESIAQLNFEGVPEVPDEDAVYRSLLVIQTTTTGGQQREAHNRQTGVSTNQHEVRKAVVPVLAGQPLNEIPFVFIGSTDLDPLPDQIPLLGLGRLAVVIYRGDADYRHTLFMQGQDTLVIIGDSPAQPDDPNQKKQRVVGASATLELPTNADAKFIGVSADGLSEQRQAIDNDRNHASEIGANLVQTGKSGAQREAGETLRIRLAAKTATLMTIVRAGAEGLQTSLRQIARWRGLDPNEVIVTPNLDFVEDAFKPADAVEMQTAKNMGLPLSRESVHAWLKKKDVTFLDFEEEMRLLEEENLVPRQPGNGTGAGGDNEDGIEEV